MTIKKRKFKYLRDLLVRGRYEQTLSLSIAKIIEDNITGNNIKILDYGSGIEPTITQMVRDHLSKISVNIVSHGYDLYDNNQIKKLNNISKNEYYFKSSDSGIIYFSNLRSLFHFISEGGKINSDSKMVYGNNYGLYKLK